MAQHDHFCLGSGGHTWSCRKWHMVRRWQRLCAVHTPSHDHNDLASYTSSYDTSSPLWWYALGQTHGSAPPVQAADGADVPNAPAPTEEHKPEPFGGGSSGGGGAGDNISEHMSEVEASTWTDPGASSDTGSSYDGWSSGSYDAGSSSSDSGSSCS
jgi:hypothetical protein